MSRPIILVCFGLLLFLPQAAKSADKEFGVITFSIAESPAATSEADHGDFVEQRLGGIFAGKVHWQSAYVVVFHRLQPETNAIKKKDRFGAYRGNRKLEDALERTQEYVRVPVGLYVLSSIAVHDETTFLTDDAKVTCLPIGGVPIKVEAGKATYLGDFSIKIRDDLSVAVLDRTISESTLATLGEELSGYQVVPDNFETATPPVTEASLKDEEACQDHVRAYYRNRPRFEGEWSPQWR